LKRVKKDGSQYLTSCPINRNTLGVPKNFFYLQNIFKIYKRWSMLRATIWHRFGHP